MESPQTGCCLGRMCLCGRANLLLCFIVGVLTTGFVISSFHLNLQPYATLVVVLGVGIGVIVCYFPLAKKGNCFATEMQQRDLAWSAYNGLEPSLYMDTQSDTKGSTCNPPLTTRSKANVFSNVCKNKPSATDADDLVTDNQSALR